MIIVEIHGLSASRAADLAGKILKDFDNLAGDLMVVPYPTLAKDSDGCCPFFRVLTSPGTNAEAVIETLHKDFNMDIQILALQGYYTKAPQKVAATSQYEEKIPDCQNCGKKMVRNGNCYKCYNCGETLGCS